MPFNSTSRPDWGRFTCVDCGVEGERRAAKQARCAVCGAQRRQALAKTRGALWRAQNAERLREYRAARYAANKKTVAARNAEWRAANPDRARAIAKRTYERSKDTIKARASAWNKDNAERRRDIARESYRRRKERDPERFREEKRRRRARPGVRLNDAVSAAMRLSLKGSKGGQKWERLVSYSAAELAAHLERQFLRGMSWGNFGEWHIDHIQPVASFDFNSPDDPDFKACWALTNLRPLWAAENHSKNAKRLLLL